MARVKAFVGVDMGDASVWYGRIYKTSAHRIVISDGWLASTYLGHFGYSWAGDVYGTLTGYQVGAGGRTLLSATGLDVDASFAQRVIERGGLFPLYREGLRGADKILGSRQNDMLRGFDGDDVLRGGKGRDRLKGDDGDDRLLGGGGRDRLQGGAGDDVLRGGPGADRLQGGAGRDVFVFEDKRGTDRVEDFRPDQDHIRVTTGAERLSDLTLRARHGDVVVIDDDQRIVLEDLRKADLDAGDFIFA